jgi:predicted amidophosphoribosyltransferase
MPDATRECPACAMEVDASADACPICGYEAPRQRTSLQIAAWVMVLLLLWPAFEGLMYLVELL